MAASDLMAARGFFARRGIVNGGSGVVGIWGEWAEGHTAETLSSGYAAPLLRFGPFGMTLRRAWRWQRDACYLRSAGAGEAFQTRKFPIGRFRLQNRSRQPNFPVREFFTDSGAMDSRTPPTHFIRREGLRHDKTDRGDPRCGGRIARAMSGA